ncbi:MAG: L-seryl-tRNA(Sec) selenium transferase [Desulfobacterales bacterium CG23_combo_of_CG06-09_8_20_14_all_52_9]|nr:MAG: L-seryl-tRNA(Sec) selenium transferase [Desulfobacterales bacterium CG23_combo_of_CG06-09_8_20_14_all_52_9]
MGLGSKQQNLLRMLPGVDRMLEAARAEAFFAAVPQILLTESLREVIASLREEILSEEATVGSDDLNIKTLLDRIREHVKQRLSPKLKRVINGTGVVVHTNLGRSLLSEMAVKNLVAIGSRYSNLEFDLSKGIRGSRYAAVEEILCEISGGEAAMVVNNNAGAVLLCLETLASGKKVIVSRGELVEIGGSFRIPDVMAKSGAILKEVGTTNRTHRHDYEGAIENETGLLLKVHQSNYSMVGFTASVSLSELVELGRTYHIPVMEDLGSGTFIDLSKYGLMKEPTVQESVAAGADAVTFSGDKLLGGPQAGIIIGKKELLDRIKKNPLTRALRIDKLTLAALESTLSLYRDKDSAVASIPTLKMITTSLKDITKRARSLQRELKKLGSPRLRVILMDLSSRVGGGALPMLNLPSKCLGIRIEGMSANVLERFMREKTELPVIGRIEADLFILDPRTIQDEEIPIIKNAFSDLFQRT